MNPKTRKALGYGLFAALFLIGITIAAYFDLSLSSALAGLSEKDGKLSLHVPVIASILEIIGEWPALLISAASLFIAASVLAENHKKRACLFYISAVGIASCLLLYGSIQTANYLAGSISGWILVLLAFLCVMLSGGSLLLVLRIPPQARRSWFLPAVYTLAAAILILLSVSTLKVIWGRIRLRELVAAGTLEGFTPWYQPNFFSSSRSFPSGHTAHSTLTLMLTIWLPDEKKRGRTVLVFIFAAFIAAMGVSRLAAGAHYLSDVLFGFAIAFIITEWMKSRYHKRQCEVSHSTISFDF